MKIKLVAIMLAAVAMSGRVYATLVFTINETTTDQISLSISGTLDTDTIGIGAGDPGYLAIKNDWSNNNSIHTEWFSGTPTISLNSILIGGSAPSTSLLASTGAAHDSIFFVNPLGAGQTISAGTVVSGSLVLTGIGMFNPADSPTLELLSGWNGFDYARHEAFATVVPEPATAGMLAISGLVFYAIRRIKNFNRG